MFLQQTNYSFSQLQQIIRHQLILSTTTSDQQQIKAVTENLDRLKKLPGYMSALLSIIKSNPQDSIVLAALAQLKNVGRLYWQRNLINQETPLFIMPDDEKRDLLRQLMIVNVQLSQNYQYSKLMKDILTLVGRQIIDASPEIQIFLQQGQQLRASFNFLLAVIDDVYFSYSKQQKVKLNSFINTFIPLVIQLVENGQSVLVSKYDSLLQLQKTQAASTHCIELVSQYKSHKCFFDEIVYLSIKFMKKLLKAQHLNAVARSYAFKFAKVALTRLTENNPIYSQQATVNPEDCGNKGSDKFNYFHGKKWACRYMIEFFRNVMVFKRNNPAFNAQTKQFLDNHQASFILQVMHNCLQIPEPRKLKFYELKMLQVMIQSRRKAYLREFRSQLNFYQRELLPRFIHFTFQDMELARDSPIDFMNEQINSCNFTENIKKIASHIWCEIAQMQFEYYEESNQSGAEWLIQNLQLINSWMVSPNDNQCETGAFLLIRMSGRISQLLANNYRSTVQLNLQILLHRYLTKMLGHSNQIFNARGLQLLDCYANFFDDDTMMQVKQYILDIVRQEGRRHKKAQSDGLWLIKLTKGVIAFGRVFHRKLFRQLEKQDLQLYLMIILGLIQKYESQKLMNVFISFVDCYHEHITQHTERLVKMMGHWYRKYLETGHLLQKQQQNGLAQDLHRIASACILVLVTFIQVATKNIQQTAKWQTVMKQISNQTVKILLALFTRNFQALQEEESTKDALFLLSKYLRYSYNANIPLSSDYWFFYRIILLRVNGLENKQKRQALLEELGPDSPHVAFIEAIDYADSQYYQNYMIALRNYIKHLDPKEPIQPPKILSTRKGGNLSSLFRLIQEFYSRNQQKQFIHEEYAKGQILSTLLLIYLLQLHGKALTFEVCKVVLSIIMYNFSFSRSRKILIKYNMQLFSLWIWTFQEQASQILLGFKPVKLKKFLLEIFPLEEENSFKMFKKVRQITRVVLGLGSYIKFSIANNLNMRIIGKYIELAIKLASQNIMSKQFYDYQEEMQQNEDDQVAYYWERNSNESGEDGVQTVKKQQSCQVNQSEQENYVVEFTKDDNISSYVNDSYDSDLSECSNQNYCSASLDHNEARFLLDCLKQIRICYPEAYNSIATRQLQEGIQDLQLELQQAQQDRALMHGDTVYTEQIQN